MAFAASTAPRDAERMGGGEKVAYRMVASKTIYKGDIVFIDISDGNDAVQSLLADASMATGDVFAGIAAETKTSGASAPAYIEVYVTGSFVFNAGAETAAASSDVGVLCYADVGASGTPAGAIIGTGSTHDMCVGTCIDVISTSKRRIRIDGCASVGGAAGVGGAAT